MFFPPRKNIAPFLFSGEQLFRIPHTIGKARNASVSFQICEGHTMKKFLLAASVAALTATAAFTQDSHTVVIDSNDEHNLTINGQTIDVRDDGVYIDGERVEDSENGTVVIENGNIRVVEGAHTMRWRMERAERDTERATRHAERATRHAERAMRHAERRANRHNGNHEVIVDIDGIQATVMESLSGALLELDDVENARIIHFGNNDDGRSWDDLTEEEKEEVREELREARLEIQEAMAEMEVEMRDHHAQMEVHRVEMEHMGSEMANFHVAVNVGEINGEVMHALEEALEGLEDGHVMHSSDWDDLSEEEQAEVRAELREAREELREHMRELSVERGEHRTLVLEMREGEREMARELREMAREMRDVEREVRREARDAARDEARSERRERRHSSRRVIRNQHRDAEGNASDIRVEEDTTGRRRVWVDGEEKTGDDLIDWLNRLESSRLAGGE
jgi:hypothetical protein